MILQGDFFSVIQMQAEGTWIKATIGLNPSHAIFDGHFPGTPVVPGVCMMQMVKEMVESATGKQTMLSRADMMKFLVVVNPRVNELIQMHLKYTTLDNVNFDVNASILIEVTICFKFKGLFVAL